MISESDASTSEWWEKRRLRFNITLAGAAIVSFIALAFMQSIFSDRLPCLEFTIFTIIGSAVGFGFCLCLANLFYLLGPFFEKKFSSLNSQVLRHGLYFLGTGFSVLLIFLPVIANLVEALFSSPTSGRCE